MQTKSFFMLGKGPRGGQLINTPSACGKSISGLSVRGKLFAEKRKIIC
jgi:hypothetical protein